MRIVRAALGTCVVLLAITAAAAQSGGITVVVGDAEGSPLPGAQVTISHETGSVKMTTELTNKKGRVDFPVLRAGGGYTIQISFPGFAPMRYDDVRVKISETETLAVNLAEEFQERITVSAQADVIDLDKSQTSTRFSDDFIQDLPVPGRFYQNVLTMAPGVQDADGDGNPNVHGSRSRDFQAVVGGVSNVDPLTGKWLSRINPNSIEEMEVITAGAGVEFGRAQGGYARIIQKQGSNTHEGVIEMYYRTSKLDGNGANDDSNLPDTEFNTYQPSFQFSGPLLRDKLWYRASYELIDREEPVNILSGIAVETTKSETIDAQVTWQVSPRNKLALQFRSDPIEQSNLGISSRVLPDSSLARKREVETWTVNWTAPYSPKVLVESAFAWQDINENVFPSTQNQGNSCVPNSDQDFLNGAYCNNSTENTVSGSWYQDLSDHRQRLTVKSSATLYSGRFWGMTHTFKLGFSVENERYFRSLISRPLIFYREVANNVGDNNNQQPPEEGDEPELEAYGLINSVLSIPQSDDIRATGTNWGMYGEDQFKPSQNLTLTLGLRVDREEINSAGLSPFDPKAELEAYQALLSSVPTNSPGWVNLNGLYPQFFTGYENMDGFVGQLQSIVCAGLDGNELGNCLLGTSQSVLQQEVNSLEKKRQATSINITNTNFSPQIAVAWLPWANGKTAFKASVGRYYNNLPLNIPLQELNPALTQVTYRASLTDPDLCPPPNEDDDGPAPSVACGKTELAGGISPLISVSTVDRNLRTPYQDEFTFKVERELWAETSMSLTYINRKFRDQIQDININLDAGDFGRCLVHTGASNSPMVVAPGTSTMSCSGAPLACAVDSDCGVGQTCGFFFDIGPNNWLADPFTGTIYPDTNPGDGDGYFDPLTQSFDDNCVGESRSVSLEGDEVCEGVFCDNFDFVQSPDEVTDLYLQNPFWGDIYLIGNFNAADYEAVVLEVVRRQYRSWEMNASYTYSEAKGDGEDFFQALGDLPNLRDDVKGFQSYDQTHVVKLNATTVTPWGIRLGTSVSWQSGLPYSRNLQFLSFDTLPPSTDVFGNAGLRTRQPYVTGQRNDERNDSFWNVDLRATKELRLGKSMNVQISAEIFNLFDDGTYRVYNTLAERGQQINGINEALPRFGRRWQLGMKLSF